MTVIAAGMMVQMALKAAERLAEEGLSVRVLDMHTIKPLDGELVLKAALETGAIVTTEEANVEVYKRQPGRRGGSRRPPWGCSRGRAGCR